MRTAALALVAAFGLAAAATTANAAPIAPAAATQASNIVQVAGGCGRGAHPNRWGHCNPSHSYRGHAEWRSHWHGYYGGGRGPWSPSDHVANQLNRHQLMGGY